MSKIQVDAIEQQTACGTTLTAGGGAGKTVVVDATTVTLGRCGGTVALASGASQTGFGRTGTVDWQTGSIKTTTFTAANGEGYFVDTSSGGVTANLPAGSAGAIVAFSDYTRTFQTYNLLVTPNGSEKIGGIAQNATLSIEGQAATFVYVDATEGWINVQETSNSLTGTPPYIQATGGTPTQNGDYEIRTFTGPGDFIISSISPTPANNKIDYLIVGGGGGGGSPQLAGGGGAGGYRETPGTSTGSYTASPIAGSVCAVCGTVTTYPIVVGGGGPGGVCTGPGTGGPGVEGNVSSAFGQTSAGGGTGGGLNSGDPGGNGANGGGGGGNNNPTTGGTGNTPPTSPAQGNDGGAGRTVPGCRGGGGGGGAICAGQPGQPPYQGGNGGDGATSSITGSPVTRAGGGGGAGNAASNPQGGAGGGGGGGSTSGNPPYRGTAGTDNTGGGGGGGGQGPNNPGLGTGGSGIVIIRYKFQN